MGHEIFRFKSQQDLQEKISSLKLDIHLAKSLNSLKLPLQIKSSVFPNRLIIHPMEGCDSSITGVPTSLTKRRYRRFGTSGAGLIWYESTAISKESRSNPYQLMLTEENKNSVQKLIVEAEKAEQINQNRNPNYGKSIKILQLNHSGRYSRPEGKYPQRMYKYAPLDERYHQKTSDGTILSDDYLSNLASDYETATALAKEIGFDGVDIKLCHRYLLNESLSAFTRANSPYGGESFENRTRLVKDIVKRVSSKFGGPNFLIASRMNIYDGIPYPYGWGVKKEENAQYPPTPDLTEPIQLITDLHELGMDLFNLSLGNPYFDPSLGRPFDQTVPGGALPQEHPLEGVARFLSLTRTIRQGIPKEVKIIGTGYSWLREYSSLVGAAEIDAGNVDMVGYGRMAFANPEFGQQIIEQNGLDPKKCCISCSKCTELMRKGTVTGCMIRDAKTYRPYFKGQSREELLKEGEI
ncbi:oxidoreductase [Candidatus Lokiarchaeum ossiferum]|uniref:oxidoreductase n=1 Tax=Candidatus Lokiarchaeum ossiferum TaxID=2951803 RepID=UPI00352BF44D